MKKAKGLIFALLVGATVLGFASCSDETQDVNIVDTVSKSNTYYYGATGTVTGTTYTYDDLDGTTGRIKQYVYTANTTNQLATISWNTSTNTNRTDYAVKIPYISYTSLNTAIDDTTTDPTTTLVVGTQNITIYKLSDGYYVNNLNSTGNGSTLKKISDIDFTANTVRLSWTENAVAYQDTDANAAVLSKPTNGYKIEKTFKIDVTLTKK